ncbi:MAG: sigma-70 family RNA polymerase sigma factor [Proteobacteria bacterium]|nr:sigma-70 family RNA polymerase sigma factor [Pseudomonadota bacterium]
MAGTDIHRSVETVFRIEQARLIAGLTRMVRDVGLAEELAQDALVTALSEWPRTGVPDNPGAWLMTTAKRRAIDRLRRAHMQERKHAEIGRDLDEARDDDVARIDAALDDDIGDDLLNLIFIACHPVLSPDARVTLTLRLIAGLSTEEIARAFLATEPTIAQRISRAKKTLHDSAAAYEAPRGEERDRRLASVLEVIYLIFNEGYAATAGDDLIRADLCGEAQRLGRILTGIAPNEPEAFGLLALMEIQASRLKARVGPDGEAIMLPEQNRALWDHLLIHHGLETLARAEALGGADGAYALQAAIAACHGRARTAADTDWPRIAALYDRLRAVTPSPVVDLNRAVAHSMAFGPEAGLELLQPLEAQAIMRDYLPLPAAKGDFLYRAGRYPQARAAFEAAASLSRNAAERNFLLKRAAACGPARPVTRE